MVDTLASSIGIGVVSNVRRATEESQNLAKVLPIRKTALIIGRG